MTFTPWLIAAQLLQPSQGRGTTSSKSAFLTRPHKTNHIKITNHSKLNYMLYNFPMAVSEKQPPEPNRSQPGKCPGAKGACRLPPGTGNKLVALYVSKNCLLYPLPVCGQLAAAATLHCCITAAAATLDCCNTVEFSMLKLQPALYKEQISNRQGMDCNAHFLIKTSQSTMNISHRTLHTAHCTLHTKN